MTGTEVAHSRDLIKSYILLFFNHGLLYKKYLCIIFVQSTLVGTSKDIATKITAPPGSLQSAD